jgi:hypothetical protein
MKEPGRLPRLRCVCVVVGGGGGGGGVEENDEAIKEKNKDITNTFQK